MKSETIPVQQVFQDRRSTSSVLPTRLCLEQRGAVEPLGMTSPTRPRCEAKGKHLAHFLGPSSLSRNPAEAPRVETYHIIDGQQRLTTLQYLLLPSL